MNAISIEVSRRSGGGPDASFRGSVLPRTADSRAFGLQTYRLQKLQDAGVRLSIAMLNDIAVLTPHWMRYLDALDNEEACAR